MKSKKINWWVEFKWLMGIVVSLLIDFIPGLGRFVSASLEKVRTHFIESGNFSPKTVTKVAGKSEHLNHDSDHNIETYYKEMPITQIIPYSEIQNFIGNNKYIKIKLKIQENNFTLGNWKDGVGDEISHAGFRLNIKKDHVNSNKKIIRVEGHNLFNNELHINIRPSYYEQQAKTNLILDYKHKFTDGNSLSLRDILNDEFTGKLPPLKDNRLANTLGVATIIFFQENGVDIPFLAKRSRTTGVFNEAPTWHCTSSFAARWQDILDKNLELFEDMIIRHLKLELLKEAGIDAENVIDLRPLAFCREFMRAGKPQLFFVGRTNLSYDVLIHNFAEARNAVVKNNERPEVTNLNRRHSISTDSVRKIENHMINQEITSEAAAGLYYYIMEKKSRRMI
jgi:hypothetical protein